MKKIFDNRVKGGQNTLSNGLLDSFAKKYTVKKFDKIIRLSKFCRDSRFFSRGSFTTSDDQDYEDDTKIESFSDYTKVLKCRVEGCEAPPLNDDDVLAGEKMFLNGELIRVEN
ncbi:hypothetical protein RF11_05287 [Thelohanellus kitauei]|uniref:Uncharacterized protein n=1 Tax=Thelohanellus kitauei TaxID=669202 RepID=A0A0C2N574_THEKT|nr:hypothetical protein RF11_05287 [Thelohanellus kitauei]